MADLEVGVNIGGDSSASGKTFGKQIADAITKSLKNLSMGKGAGGGGIGAAGAVGAGAKAQGFAMLGKIAVGVGLVVEVMKSLEFIIKPIMTLFRAALTLLFLPLIPILIPILKIMAAGLKVLASVMPKIMVAVDKMVQKSLIGFLANNADNIADVIIKISESFIILLMSLVDNIPNINKFLETFNKKGDSLFMSILDTLTFFSIEFPTLWDLIKSVLIWTGDFLGEKWSIISDALEDAATLLTEKWTGMKSAFEIIVSGLNSVATAISRVKGTFSFGSGSSKTFGGNLGNIARGIYNSVTDFMVLPGGKVLKIDPKDKILGFKGGMPGGSNVNITINNPSLNSQNDMNKFIKQLERRLQSSLRARTSYT